MDWYSPPAEPPPPRPISKARAFWLSVVPPALHIGIQAAFTFIIVFVYMFALIIREAGEGGLDAGSLIDGFLNSRDYGYMLLLTVLVSGLASIALFAVLYKRRKPQFRTLQPPRVSVPLWPVAVTAVAGNFLLTSVITAVQDILGTDLPTSGLDDILDFEAATPFYLFLALASVCVVTPIAEEFCFRGLSLNKLLAAFPFWKANVLQAAVFGVIHFYPVQICYAFLFGLLLGWIYLRTGRLGAAVFGHIVFNASPFLMAFIPGIDALFSNPYRLLLLMSLPSAAVFYGGIRFLRAASAEKNTQA